VTLKHDNYVVDYSMLGTNVLNEFKPAMSNPNGLQSQKSCHFLDQGRTLNDILIRATR